MGAVVEEVFAGVQLSGWDGGREGGIGVMEEGRKRGGNRREGGREGEIGSRDEERGE